MNKRRGSSLFDIRSWPNAPFHLKNGLGIGMNRAYPVHRTRLSRIRIESNIEMSFERVLLALPAADESKGVPLCRARKMKAPFW